jgi:hypothetical protein
MFCPEIVRLLSRPLYYEGAVSDKPLVATANFLRLGLAERTGSIAAWHDRLKYSTLKHG